MSNNNTKQYILRSTIDTIECYGLSHLTTRLIGATTRVNNAALHYCFGTKENLIDAALKQIAQQMLEDSEEILGREARWKPGLGRWGITSSMALLNSRTLSARI
ncbi:MAG: TetR family transcriptional regulator [Chloroflexota bacterium]|nr:TetR family transcriptional regulator [Chloroflexota bacterium]